MPTDRTDAMIALPPPKTDGGHSLEEVLGRRRSIRELDTPPLTLAEIGQLLWSAQGITGADGLRAAPSAGSLYPLELYVATAEGVFHYRPREHDLERTPGADVRDELRKASFDQACMTAPAVFAIAAVFGRVAEKYPEVADICVKLEVGHAAQNLLLQATALDLAAVPVAAFDPPRLQRALGLPADQVVCYLIPVGRGHEA
jgi:SagB-type dehydrogenase family enzyme